MRSLLETVGHGPGFLWDLLVDERVWLEQAVDSLRRVLATLGRDWQLPVCYQTCLTVLGCRIQQGSALLRAYSRKLIHDRGHEAQAAKALASEIQQLETDGCVVVARPCVAAQGRWRCKPCGQGFGSRAALRAHQAIRHGQRAVTAIVSGTQCLSCNQEYWSTARLRAHVSRVSRCAMRYRNADLDPPSQHELVREGTHAAWRPVTRVLAPQPFWATLDPIEADDTLPEICADDASNDADEGFVSLKSLLDSGEDVSDPSWLVKLLRWASNNYHKHEGVVCREPEKTSLVVLCVQLAASDFQPTENWHSNGVWRARCFDRFIAFLRGP